MLDQTITATPLRQRTGTLAYEPQLDGLRAVAVLAVLYSHFRDETSIAGFFGVRLFFVLSGYLITAILLNCREAVSRGKTTNEFVLKSFYLRRGLRIYPAYYFALVAAFVLNLPGLEPVFWTHAFFCSNILFVLHHAYEPWFAAPLWSVSIEEQFYLIWPFVILLTPRRFLKTVIIAAVLLGPVSRILLILLHKSDFSRFYLTPTAFDALGAGALFALTRTQKQWPAWTSMVALAAAVVCIVIRSVDRFAGPVGSQELVETLSLVALVWIVAAASLGRTGVAGRVLTAPPVRFIGRISFGLYIYHAYVWALLQQHAGQLPGSLRHTGFPLLFAGSILTFALATLSWFALEQPANRLKARFPYRPGTRFRNE